MRIFAAVVLSGAAGLMYQVAWTRRLIGVTSATAIAQAIVLAVFMAGLGLGSAIAARRSGKTAHPFRAYAYVEVAAAIFAAISIPLIGWTRFVHRAIDGAAANWTSLILVAAFLLIPTTLLGTSLSFLIEGVERNERTRARRIVGALYGANTLGAAMGCAFAGFYSTEHLGLVGTTLVGLACAIGAAALAWTMTSKPPPDLSDSTVDRAPIARRWIAYAALAGFIGLGAEIVFTRIFAAVVLNTVYAFSEVLLGVLLGIALGGFLSSALARRAPQKLDGFAGMLLAASAVMLALVPSVILAEASNESWKSELARGASIGAAAVFVLTIAVPTALTSAVLPLLVASLSGTRAARALGVLYAANTAGSVAGSLALGLWLLPALGLHFSLLLLIALALIGGIALMRGAAEPPNTVRIGALAAVTALVLSVSYRLPRSLYETILPDDHRILALEESRASDVMVTDDSRGRRRLWINSAWVATAGGGTGFGHQVFGHFPALLHGAPDRALGIALGTGQTFAAVLAEGVRHLDCVEINPSVVRLSREYFREANDGLLDRPSVAVHVEDGRAFLRSTRDRYDLIVLEPLQAWSAGTSSLYSREFYEDARRVLNPHGVLLQWIPFYGQGVAETKSMVRSGADVFPHASLWLSGAEGMLILHGEDARLDAETIGLRLGARGIDTQLTELGVLDGGDVLSHLLLGPRGVTLWTAGAELLEDDRPFLEFAAARQVGAETTAEIVASVAQVIDRDDLSDYVIATSSTAKAELAEIRAVRAAMVAAWAVPYEERAARAAVIERGLSEARGSNRLRAYYRSFLKAWVDQLEHEGRQDEIDAVRRRAWAH